MRLMQGLASSYITINQRLIVPRCKDVDRVYIEYLPFLKNVTVLDSQGHHKRSAQSPVWHQYTEGTFWYGK